MDVRQLRYFVAVIEAGKSMCQLARDVLRGEDEIPQRVKSGGGSESGTVAIGFPDTIASALATPLFKRIARRYPAIRQQIFESMSGIEVYARCLDALAEPAAAASPPAGPSRR